MFLNSKTSANSFILALAISCTKFFLTFLKLFLIKNFLSRYSSSELFVLKFSKVKKFLTLS